MKYSTKSEYASLIQEEEDRVRTPTTGSWVDQLLRPALLCIFAVLVALQLAALYIFKEQLSQTQGGSNHVESPVPKMPWEVRSFHRDPIYFNRSTPETDAAWNALSGPNQGFVSISDYKRFGFQPGAKHGVDYLYSVSMFHQLHCLARVREMLWDLASGRVNGAELIRITPNDTFVDHRGGLIHGFWEVQHCMDYIRQGIQCAGDTALEWPVKADGKTLFVGWDVMHECRNLDLISAWVNENS